MWSVWQCYMKEFNTIKNIKTIIFIDNWVADSYTPIVDVTQYKDKNMIARKHKKI